MKKVDEPLKLCKEHYHEWKSEGYTIKAIKIDDEEDCDICLQQEWLMTGEGKEI